jgi:hypothetical protein
MTNAGEGAQSGPTVTFRRSRRWDVVDLVRMIEEWEALQARAAA